jgi:nickel-dependent lactate racemase
MTTVQIWQGEAALDVVLREDLVAHDVGSRPPPDAADPLGLIANAIDEPIGAAPLAEAATGMESVAIILPDYTRPQVARVTLLPLISRLARAHIGPEQIRLVIARGIHPTAPRAEIEHMVGAEIMRVLRPVQSAPDTPGLNQTLGEHPRLGSVRVHRQVASADLVILTGIVTPHHLAGFGGGPQALVPGVAERETVVAAHRLTLDALVRPDGSIRPTRSGKPNAFQRTLLDIAEMAGAVFSLSVVLGAEGGPAAAFAGAPRESHAAAIAGWQDLYGQVEARPHAAVIVGTRGARSRDLIQGHKALLAAAPWAAPGAPIVWIVPATDGPGHPAFLPWFEAGKLPRHLAALRERFHPYGLTAYSIRRIAKDHPVHVVSEMPGDVLRPMGLLAHATVADAVAHATRDLAKGAEVAVLPAG